MTRLGDCEPTFVFVFLIDNVIYRALSASQLYAHILLHDTTWKVVFEKAQ